MRKKELNTNENNLLRIPQIHTVFIQTSVNNFFTGLVIKNLLHISNFFLLYLK